MTKSLLGLVLVVVGVACGCLAILMSLGVLLQFSRPGALYAALFWLVSGLLVATGVYLRHSP
jgi:hypothetical protein